MTMKTNAEITISACQQSVTWSEHTYWEQWINVQRMTMMTNAEIIISACKQSVTWSKTHLLGTVD